MNELNKILDKWNEYKIFIPYTSKNYDNILDKGICDIWDYTQDNTKIKLVFNEFGACLRTWQDNQLEAVVLKEV